MTAEETFRKGISTAFNMLLDRFMREKLEELATRATKPTKPARKRRARTIASKHARAEVDRHCRAPWCRGEGAPRHRFFCPKHKDLSEAQKDAYIASWKKRKGS